jgi:hypothetical protein
LVLQAGDRLALLGDGDSERDPPAIVCSFAMAFDHVMRAIRCPSTMGSSPA